MCHCAVLCIGWEKGRGGKNEEGVRASRGRERQRGTDGKWSDGILRGRGESCVICVSRKH